MLRIVFSLILLCAFIPNSNAQNKELDTKAASIPGASSSSLHALATYIKDNFTTDTARVRAIYVWITHNISYDYAALQARDETPAGPP